MREIASIDEFVRWCQDPHLHEAVAVERLDLGAYEAQIVARQRFEDCIFLGCSLSERAQHHVMARGGLLFPRIQELPFDPYHHRLYSSRDLFDGFDPDAPAQTFGQTFDQRVYAHFVSSGKAHPGSIRVSLAQSLHDHAMSDAKAEFLAQQHALGKRVMAIMGGHNIKRAQPSYRRVAHIARRLTLEGFVVATGGGPGAMEAGHLGAYFAPRSAQQLDEAIDQLAVRSPDQLHPDHPDAEYKDRDWMSRAWRVWTRFAQSEDEAQRYPSLGVPTWLYGHEPPTVFATHHAKYFANSIREEGLLSVAIDGVLYTPGRAGTVQEIFQDACQNYYGSMGYLSPMVFMDSAYWTQTLPAKALLEALMASRRHASLIAFEDDDEAIIQRFLDYDRERWRA